MPNWETLVLSMTEDTIEAWGGDGVIDKKYQFFVGKKAPGQLLGDDYESFIYKSSFFTLSFPRHEKFPFACECIMYVTDRTSESAVSHVPLCIVKPISSASDPWTVVFE